MGGGWGGKIKVRLELTSQEPNDSSQDGDTTVDDGHYHPSDGVNNCHDAVTDGLEARDDGTHDGGFWWVCVWRWLLLVGSYKW